MTSLFFKAHALTCEKHMGNRKTLARAIIGRESGNAHRSISRL
jgi:hypothetical protein